MSLETEILWKRINELEKEVALLQRRLAGAETEMHREKETANYYRGKYEIVCEIRNWSKYWQEKKEEAEHGDNEGETH